MQQYEDLPADAQIEPIPEGFEALPSDAQIEPAQGAPMPEAQYRQQLYGLIKGGKPKAEIEGFIRSQGIDPAQVQGLDEAMAAVRQGRDIGVHVRDGETQANAAGETMGGAFYRGIGDVAGGIGDLVGIVGNPLNATINALAGTNLSTDLGKTLRDATGAPEPVTDSERYISTAERSGANALAMAGAGMASSGLSGMAGYVGKRVADTAVGDFVGGLLGGAGSEGGGDVGSKVGGSTGRMVGSLLGGGTGNISGARATEVAARRFATSVPREVALDSAGNLTEEGRELAARMGISEDDAVRSYARARRSALRDDRSLAERQAAREAVRNRPREGEVLPEPAPAPQPTAEAPQQFPGLSDQTARIEGVIGDRLRTGEAFDAPNAPPPPPRDVFTEANEERIRLSRGQAEQNFDVQNDENSLRVSATREGEQARQFFHGQQRQIAGAVERLRARFGPDAGNAADRGEQVQQAVRELRDNGAEGVREMYRQAEELGGDGLTLNTQGIHDAATDVLIDEAVPEGVKRAVSQELARYGIIGKAKPTNEAGITKVVLDDGSSVSFRGPTKQLTASNAEDLRKAVNRLYDPTKPGLSGQSIKPAIDDALEEAITGAAGREGNIGNAYAAARDAYKVQRGTFHAKDIVDSLTAVKKGTQTPVLLPERSIAQVIGSGADGVTNLRKVKGLLLSSGTVSSKQAWAAIQHQALADIFDNAWSRNVNHGSGQIGDVISGAKLNSAIDKFGIDKLRTLLSPEDFNGLMKLRRIVGAATIPITGTTNPSGTATKIINYLKQGTLRFAGAIPGVGTAANAFTGLAAKGKEIAATRKTLEGITSYTGPESSRRMDQKASEFVAEYIRSGKSGELVPASINLSATQGGRRDD